LEHLRWNIPLMLCLDGFLDRILQNNDYGIDYNLAWEFCDKISVITRLLQSLNN